MMGVVGVVGVRGADPSPSGWGTGGGLIFFLLNTSVRKCVISFMACYSIYHLKRNVVLCLNKPGE